MTQVLSPQTITILGSTGSIGCSTVALIAANPHRFRVAALVAQNNIEKLIEQALLLRPALAVIANTHHYPRLQEALAGLDILTATGDAAVLEASAYPSDVVVAAIVGAAGLAPTLTAIRRGANIALANKESLVCAGELIGAEALRHGATILPVDSEHNAIFQVFDFTKPERVAKIILTASGGPFRQFTTEQMQHVTPAMAVKHPNWQMGAKISVDSATLMNKGLEMIEARYLFPIQPEQIDVLVHPESIIHSMVEYRDGSVLAQLGVSDMTIPIAYALAYPERIATSTPRLNLAALGSLHFEEPDAIRFPALRLARETLQAGGIAPLAYNAANEVAVAHFLNGRIPFLAIAALVEQSLHHAASITGALKTLEDILEADRMIRHYTEQSLAHFALSS
jgi:1-deoxy-D-xylulose-5-phosphate reductoisomerase